MSKSSRSGATQDGPGQPIGAPQGEPHGTARSIEFKPGPEPVCGPMRALAGKRLLVKDAPLLPLPGCDQPACGCRYKLYSDRRTDVRRRADAGFQVSGESDHPFLSRRSESVGRRSSDS